MVITYPIEVLDDYGSPVSGATVTIASVVDKIGSAVASHGAVVNAAGANYSVDYDPEAKGEAWINLGVSKVGSQITGRNATPSRFCARDSSRVLLALPNAAMTAQTGDTYARLGAPAGASIAADIATRSSHTAAQAASAVRAELTTELARLDQAISAAKTLTPLERTAIANEVQARIIDESDSQAVLLAISNKIAQANPDLSGLTLAAIAAAVRTNLSTELADIVALEARVSAARALLLDNLSRLDVAVSTAATPAQVTAAQAAVIAALPTDYQQRGVAVTLPASAATQTTLVAGIASVLTALEGLDETVVSGILAVEIDGLTLAQRMVLASANGRGFSPDRSLVKILDGTQVVETLLRSPATGETTSYTRIG